MAIKVGFIGLYRDLQLTLVENILKAEFPLTVYHPSDEPLEKAAQMGARVASSPKEVAKQADIIAVSLRDESETEEAVLGPEGVLAGAQPGSLIAIHTTVEPAFVVRMGEAAKQQDVGVLDVAFSGGVEMARTSSMLYAVGATALGAGLMFTGASAARDLTDARARQVFFASLLYHPLLLGLMLFDTVRL